MSRAEFLVALGSAAVHLGNVDFRKPMPFDLGWGSRWKQLQALVTIFVLSTVTAAAEPYHVAPSGSDANDCLSPSNACATFQRVVNLCPVGIPCAIMAAPGVYSQKTNVFYYKAISVFGPKDKDGNCIDRGAVVVDDRINGVGQADAIFWVQDHAILTIQCISLVAYANGSTGFATRQFAIGDVNYVDFGQFRSGHGVVANETSKANIFSPGIYGDASRFAVAGDLSQINITGTIRIGDRLTFDVAFLSSLLNSIVSVNASAIVGGEHMSGASYQCNDGVITKNVTLPGGDVPYVGNENCKVFGLAPDEIVVDHKLGPIYSQLKAIRSELDENLNPGLKTIRAELDGKLNPELKTIHTELAEKIPYQLKMIRVELHELKVFRNAIITVVAVLTVALMMVGAFYLWQPHRRR